MKSLAVYKCEFVTEKYLKKTYRANVQYRSTRVGKMCGAFFIGKQTVYTLLDRNIVRRSLRLCGYSVYSVAYTQHHIIFAPAPSNYIFAYFTFD